MSFPQQTRSYETDEPMHDENGYAPVRQRGRTAPEKSEPAFDINLNGETIGTVYPLRLTGAAQIDLEEARSTRQVIAWLVTYAGGDAQHVEAMLRQLPLGEITTFVQNVATALSQSIALGNRNGPR